MAEYVQIEKFKINFSDNNRWSIEINQTIVAEDFFIALLHNDDWLASFDGKLIRKGVTFCDKTTNKPSKSNLNTISEGLWSSDIPDSITIGEGQYVTPDFRVWFEYQLNNIESFVYVLIDGFVDQTLIYMHSFWLSPTISDGPTGFLNIGRPPIDQSSQNSIHSTKSSILAFGNYHENEDTGEILVLKGGMQVWSTPHFVANWNGLKSRPPICTMLARSKKSENNVDISYIGWMTVNKWGSRSVMHVGTTVAPELFGKGIKVFATANRKNGQHQHLPGVIIGLGDHPRALLSNISDLLAAIVCRLQILRKNKIFPEPLNYLGWCTWNGLGERRFLSGENIVKFWQEWGEKYRNIPFRMMIIDDGWQHVEKVRETYKEKELAMTKFDPNNKFPSMATLKSKIQAINPAFQYLGVWHTILGYWGGSAVPGYPLLPETSRIIDLRPFKHIPTHYPILNSYLPDSVSADPNSPSMQFYQKWYAFLKKEGVDFTKVDAQNSISNSLNADNENDSQKGLIELDYAARILQEAKEYACKTNQISSINCMCMVPTSWQHWTGSAVSRCSGDFCMGDLRYSAFLMHQAALNQIWYSNFVWSDWDMWNSNENQPHLSETMAICRAISGGPIYVTDYPEFAQHLTHGSDKPGEWLNTKAGMNKIILQKLAHPITGQVARFIDPALPNYFSLWNDARELEKNSELFTPLVINNRHYVEGFGTIGYVAVMNVSVATTRVNLSLNDSKETRQKTLDWNAPAKKCSITHEMIFDAPEYSRGVERTTENVILHEITTKNPEIQLIPLKNEKSSTSEFFAMEITLAPMQTKYFQVIPLKGSIIPLGTPLLFNQMWIFESITMNGKNLHMKLKFPAPIQLYHPIVLPNIIDIRVWNDECEINFVEDISKTPQLKTYWTREGTIDTIVSNSVNVNYRVNI